jgi:DegV family protein with EDD domain
VLFRSPTTAAGPVGETVEVMAAALADADHVIAITAATELSAIHNTFRLAAEQTDPARVTLIDSRTTTMGLGWQVTIAAEMIANGADADAIAAHLRDVQPRTDVWAALDTLENLRRSGRVSWTAAMVGSWFQIKPIVRLHDGVVSSYTRVRTSQRAFDTLVEIAHEAAPLERLAVLHTNNLAAAQRLMQVLADVQPEAAGTIVDVTPVIGLHVGANGLGLGLVRKAS